MGTYDWVRPLLFGETQEGTEGPVFIAFDTETTGLEPKTDKIVEIGAVKFDRLGIIGRFSVLINPGIPMPAEAARVNGITDEMLRKQPPIEEVLPDFLRFIGKGILVAHNAPFDVSFINAALGYFWKKDEEREKRDTNQPSLLDPVISEPKIQVDEHKVLWKPPFPALPHKIVDTRILAKELIPGRYSYKLQDLAEYLKIKALEAHRAEDDARVCMEVFVQCTRLIPATQQ
ncbi:PolC-type DNA polymerase III [Gracilinema caldarium]|uniref:DNA polymerase III, epsilon subunit n=1 Tax=Gracilinema caldarium (strain ATCC 51460 / DSM 7334 / H1) TaxID=744872 RepID=F8EXF0_GRAC1|nr:3'-5' exonuclease [Gracilinema caldarium]AEJ19177.1 DNA polymerase III, epsilon subunit [Gracilinema caldarium DSM 7334]